MRTVPPGLKPFFVETGDRTGEAVRFHDTENLSSAIQTPSINADPLQVYSCCR
jgi:hypothetical protein